MTHLSLFSGIGGFDLAAEWAGFTTVAFVEKDPYCQKVLARHWPGVPIYDDVQTFDGRPFAGVTVLSGGFPCQDISTAGKGGGLDGSRSGLFFEMLRIIGEARPHWVIAENSPALRTRGADRVLVEMERIGYAGWPSVVHAGGAGAPHIRKRAYILFADIDRLRELQPEGRESDKRGRVVYGGSETGLARYTDGIARDETDTTPGSIGTRWHSWDSTDGLNRSHSPESYWSIHQPPVVGVDDGIPNRSHRVRALGNAVVPQVAAPFFTFIRRFYD